jgi:hypothetical protein
MGPLPKTGTAGWRAIVATPADRIGCRRGGAVLEAEGFEG